MFDGTHLFSDDPALPVQFYHDGRRMVGSRALCFAILDEAIDCLDYPLPRTKKGWRAAMAIRAHAREWIESDDESRVHTFVRVCEALGYEPSAIRARVLNDGVRLSRYGLRGNSGRPHSRMSVPQRGEEDYGSATV